MRGGSNRRRQNAPTDAPQQLILRALVGSLFVCAALVSPARAQSADGNKGGQPRADASAEQQRYSQLVELLGEVRRLVKPDDFAHDKTFVITVKAQAVGNPDDDPLHYFEIKCDPATDQFWCEVVSRLVMDLRGSAIHGLVKDASRLDLTINLDGQKAVASLAAEFVSDARAQDAAYWHKVFINRALQDYKNEDLALVLNNMTVSASGKQLSLKLEMSREQAGNLLRKHLALP